MKVDVLIIGQGISGTFLSWYLMKEGRTVMVMDNNYADAPSKIAAGIINPVTGRRLVTVWMVNEVLPFAWKVYSEIGQELGIHAISQRSIIDFFPNPFMRENFLQKIESGDEYVHTYPEQNHFNKFFNYEFGCGEIRPVYTANLEALLPAWRKRLIENQSLLEDHFHPGDLIATENGVRYQNIEASQIIFCDGSNSFDNPFFRNLPFAPNKGESLVAIIPGLPTEHIFKKGLMIVPLSEKNHFWIGASYLWDFDNLSPTKAFRESTEKSLAEWLKIPFTITDHRAAMRPATLERRPFVGFHPLHPRVGILNGMGTKGCSLAPFFAKQLTDHLIYHMPVAPDADVGRFKKILEKTG
jgi:glycine/D-amino acid oxidase-like deaminating enzyme